MATDKNTRCSVPGCGCYFRGRWEPKVEFSGRFAVTFPLLICSLHRDRLTGEDVVNLLSFIETTELHRALGVPVRGQLPPITDLRFQAQSVHVVTYPGEY